MEARSRERGRRGALGRLVGAVSVLAISAMLPAIGATAAPGEDTIWLCKPGAEPNPCRESLETTVDSSSGDSHIENPPLAANPKIDCFYVYPTVSGQPTQNANRNIDQEQIEIARYQASRFSQRCRVFAPVYRQLTLVAIQSPPEQQAEGIKIAYADVLSAWQDYLANYNHGRRFVLLGHSQGSGLLTGLVRNEIDSNPNVRGRLVKAILLGANVTTRKGENVGGSFNQIPVCTERAETGCVIAYSTFNETPPDDTKFGRPSGRFADVFGIPSGPDLEVACTNPVALGGGSGPLHTLVRSEPFPGLIGALLIYMYGGPPPSAPTPWLEPQDHYTGQCVRDNGAHVLMISPVGNARKLNPSPDDTWGLHLADVNIALGNLVDLIGAGARCAGREATQVGTDAREVIVGTSERDVIAAKGGRDVVKGLGGRDVVCGGSGRDVLRGGGGPDALHGGKGRDRCMGGKGRDSARGCERPRYM